MGGWMLEVGKMALYMAFPVTLFHIFNQPEYFEEWVTKTKQEIYPPESESNRKQLQEAIKAIRSKRDQELLKAYEEAEANRQIKS